MKLLLSLLATVLLIASPGRASAATNVWSGPPALPYGLPAGRRLDARPQLVRRDRPGCGRHRDRRRQRPRSVTAHDGDERLRVGRRVASDGQCIARSLAHPVGREWNGERRRQRVPHGRHTSSLGGSVIMTIHGRPEPLGARARHCRHRELGVWHHPRCRHDHPQLGHLEHQQPGQTASRSYVVEATTAPTSTTLARSTCREPGNAPTTPAASGASTTRASSISTARGRRRVAELRRQHLRARSTTEAASPAPASLLFDCPGACTSSVTVNGTTSIGAGASLAIGTGAETTIGATGATLTGPGTLMWTGGHLTR